MVRYHDDEDSGTGRALLVTAGVAAGLLAGAVVAQRLGGWKGLRKLLRNRRHPLHAVLSRVLPGGIVATVLDSIGIDEMVSALLHGRRGSGARLRRRRYDEELDEYELDEVERATAGLDHDDDEESPRALRLHDDEVAEEDEEQDVGEDEGEDEDVDGYDELVGDEEDEEDEADGDDEIVGEDEWEEEEEEPEHFDEEEDEIVESISFENVEREVLAAFRRHPLLRQRALEIAVDEEGVLELTGWVRRERELRVARRVAARVPGVERVVVDVAIRDGMRTAARTEVRSDARTDAHPPTPPPQRDAVPAGRDPVDG